MAGTDYNSIYTGPEIDAALNRAKAGGDIDVALAKKAAAGFGYGETYLRITSESANESYETFCAKIDEVLIGLPNQTCKQLVVYPPQLYGSGNLQLANCAKWANDYASVTTITNYDRNQCGFRMLKINDVWQPLEWFYPRLNSNIEYRTVERIFGEPVYEQTVGFGALPNATSKTLTHGIADISRILRVDIIQSNGTNYYNGQVQYTANNTNIVITTTANLSSASVYVRLKYTKTTG